MVVVPPLSICRLPASKSASGGRGAAIGHMGGLDAGSVEEELGGEMHQPAWARSSRSVSLPRLAPAQRHQLAQRLQPAPRRSTREHAWLVE